MKNKLLLMVFFSISFLLLRGQDKTAEDYFIGRKVNASNDYNTGRLGFSIPLFDLKVDGVNLGPSINYASDMNQLDIEPTIIGKNWNLNMMGKITISYTDGARFLEGHTAMSSWLSNGFESHAFPGCYFKGTTTTPKKTLYENPEQSLMDRYQPNKYYFDFLGYSGSFIQDNNGKFLVDGNDMDFKIEFNGDTCFNITSSVSLNSSFPEFIITDNKGNKFFFGGDYNTLDVYYAKMHMTYSSIQSYPPPTSVTSYQSNLRTNYVAALYLKKVILHNGRTIDVIYKKGNPQTLSNFTNGGAYVNSDYSFQFPDNQTLLNNNLYIGFDKGKSYSYFSSSSGFGGSTTTNMDTKIYQKLAIIDSVNIADHGSIKLNYTNTGNAVTKPFVNKIDFRDVHGKKIQSVQLDYTNSSNNSVFLKKLRLNSNDYEFDYYTDQDQTILQTPGYAYTTGKNGLLKEIIFPTRGRESFEYEQNSVGKINEIDDKKRNLKSVVNFVDGQRLKKIKSTNGNKNIIKNFSYLNDDGTPSGILTYRNTTSPVKADLPMYDSPGVMISMTQKFEGYYNNYVRYSSVTEEIENKEKNKYYFSDLITNPDSLATKFTYNLNYVANVSPTPLYIRKDQERGKLLQVNKYNAANDLVYSEARKYTNFLKNILPIGILTPNSNVNNDKFYIEATQHRYGIKEGYYAYQPMLPYLPVSIISRELTSDKLNYIEKVKKISYNNSYLYWHSNPIVEKTESLGVSNVSRTYYPGDLLRRNSSCANGNCPPDTDQVGGKFSIYKNMVDNNINVPIITVLTNSSNKTALTESVYKKDNSSGNLLRQDKKRVSLLSTEVFVDNLQAAQVTNKEQYDLYDNKGNILQMKNEDEMPVTTIWGYHQTLPIAKIEGATYAQVMQAFNLDPNSTTSYLQLEIVKKSDLDKSDATESELLNQLKIFRVNSLLSNFRITTMVHDEFIGTKGTIDPSGIQKGYKYDNFNRLQQVLNSENKVVTEYNYHHAPIIYYNTAKSQDFTTTNCGPGTVPATGTYTVPAAKYSSLISQADADQKAQNDINTSGQSYVNANVPCTPFVCTITPTYLAQIYYSSFQEISAGHIKAILSFPITSSGSNTPNWSNGVFIGTLDGMCRPNSYKSMSASSGSDSWSISIGPSGDVTVRSISGSSGYGGATLYFEYDK